MAEIYSKPFGSDLGPGFKLVVEGTRLDTDISQYISHVEYESAADMANQLTITVNNPGHIFDGPDFTEHKVFQPGNEIELRGGYGGKYDFIGRAIISKHIPVFPEDGMPTLTIKGYDRSTLMMEASGKLSASGNKVMALREGENKDDQGEVHKNVKGSDIVAKIAAKYGFATDIDATDRILKYSDSDGIVQKKGLSDFELVKILANLGKRDLWVDFDPAQRKWVLHFKKFNDTDQPGYIFRYGMGDKSTLLSFDCEYGLRENITELVVLAWDDTRGEWISVGRVEEPEGTDPRWRQGGGRMERTKPIEGEDPTKKVTDVKGKAKRTAEANAAMDIIKQTLKSATQFRFSAGGTAIDVVAGRPFRDIQDATDFAYRWFKANKDNFLVGRGRLVGMESLRARQVHKLEGLGNRLSGGTGAYYFISVTHVFDAEQGYTCDFTARKVVD